MNFSVHGDEISSGNKSSFAMRLVGNTSPIGTSVISGMKFIDVLVEYYHRIGSPGTEIYDTYKKTE